MNADPNRIAALFAAALAKSTPEERAAYLDGACGGDAELRRRVEALLQAHDEAGSFLNRPVASVSVTTDEPAGQWIDRDAPPVVSEGPGTRIGPYKLLQKIGEGGMGVVFMAEQQEPIRRMVALKIIKPGMDSAAVIARFEAERQALALMDHQNIARVFDGGTTDSGRPYFVMELVKGISITRFCDENRLTPRERLELFVPVCQAVQHAHQKGVIHRDLKPSNVLVTLYDGQPVPKVIDFGVAKALHQKLTERTMFTAFGTVVGTLEYMSPEQAELNALDVDTRGDVYSLGVLLYELLTGTTPLKRERLKQAAYDEILRLIREEEPPRPSTRISSSNEALVRISAQRKMQPAQLARLLRGELDWIVMKALEKERSRRYETAIGLARDVERYLHDEAVEACPPSARYRLGKFARKYKKALTIAAAFVAILVVGVVISTLLAVWATSAEREANRQRIASDEAKGEALEAKGEAVKQRDEARVTAYASGMQLAQRAWEENDVPRARELLEEVPKEAGGRDLRGFEWYYLSRLCHSETRTLTGHAGGVGRVAFSPDGQRLASGSWDKTIKIWDSVTGKEMLTLKGHTDRVTSVAFSPDGQRLASGSWDKTVRIWNSATGKELFTFKGHADHVYSVAFSPDGKRLASGSGDKTVKIWDSVTGKELLALGHDSSVYSVAFSPDGRLLASGAGYTAKIWDSALGKELFALTGHDWSVNSVAFSPDGLHLASGSLRTVKIWDSATGKEMLALKGHTDEIIAVAFSPDGQRLASGSDDRTVKIWDSVTGKELFALKGHDNLVRSVAFSPDGQRLASGSDDATVKIWDSVTGKELFALKGHDNLVRSVAFSPDGQRLASGSDDATVNIYDSATGKELFAREGDSGQFTSVAFSPDGRLLASGSGKGTLKLWDSGTGKELFALKGHEHWVYSLAFSPDGQRLASGSKDKTVKLWDSATGRELLTLKGHASDVNSVAFSPDGKRLASGSDDKTVKIWDSVTGKELLAINGHSGNVNSVAFSPDGKRLASGSADTTVRIWDSATGKELLALKGHLRAVTSVAFSPGGQRLASGSWDETVKIWDSATGKELFSLKAHPSILDSVAFSPDGQRLAAAGFNSVTIWETIIPPEVQDRRAANQLVADLFRQLGFRASVLERLRALTGMNPTRRNLALAAAQTYPENPDTLNQLAWNLVAQPDRQMLDYRKALRYSERACQLEPRNGAFLNTQGVVYYRVGDYRKALETLQRSDKLHQAESKASLPADLAFLAMTQQRLGHAKEARDYLQQLRERMKDPRWAKNAEVQGFLREAETLLAKPTTPPPTPSPSTGPKTRTRSTTAPASTLRWPAR